VSRNVFRLDVYRLNYIYPAVKNQKTNLVHLQYMRLQCSLYTKPTYTIFDCAGCDMSVHSFGQNFVHTYIASRTIDKRLLYAYVRTK